MHILEQKKRSHIAGYIIAMWHVEDLIRAKHFSLSGVLDVLVPISAPPEERYAAEQVYGGMLERMRTQGLKDAGHLLEVVEAIGEMQFLHDSLVGAGTDEEYIELYEKAKPSILDLLALAGNKGVGEISASFNGVYGVMLLRGKNANISQETLAAERDIRALLDGLSDRFRAIRSFPDPSLN